MIHDDEGELESPIKSAKDEGETKIPIPVKLPKNWKDMFKDTLKKLNVSICPLKLPRRAWMT